MAEDLEEDFDDVDADDDGGGSEVTHRKTTINKKLILLIVLPILLVIGATAGAYFTMGDQIAALFGGGEEEHAEEAPPANQPAVQAAAVFFDVPEMLVNLNVAGRKQAFLKIRVSLELESAADTPRVEQMLPRIVDNFQVYLRELRVEDLQGAAGMYRLREELLMRVNAAVKPAKVNDVLFKEMLVQ